MIQDELDSTTKSFPVAEASLFKRRELLRRVDTKFVAPADQLEEILGGLEHQYARVLAGGATWASYETLYFDTPDDLFFHDHRRGRLGRCKVRIRHYVDREKSYFEVKLKSNQRVTSKLRRLKSFRHTTLEEDDQALVGQVPQIPGATIVARLWTIFSRLQLVSLAERERVTIDVGVRFRHGQNAKSASLDDLATQCLLGRPIMGDPPEQLRPLAIVEVKQPSLHRRTPIMLALRRAGVRRRRSSKYCTGVMLTDPLARAHRFLPTIKQIARLQCSSS